MFTANIVGQEHLLEGLAFKNNNSFLTDLLRERDREVGMQTSNAHVSFLTRTGGSTVCKTEGR